MPEISRRIVLAAVAGSAVTAFPNKSFSNISDDVVGTWILVSIHRELEDGSKVYNMGENPRGLFMFDAKGRFSHHLVRADGVRLDCKATEGASEENQAAALGASSYYGSYEVSSDGGSVLLKIEGSLLARQNGTQQRRFIKIMGDTMEYWTPKIPSAKGAFVRRLVWRRA